MLKKDNTSHKFGSKKSKASKFLVDKSFYKEPAVGDSTCRWACRLRGNRSLGLDALAKGSFKCDRNYAVILRQTLLLHLDTMPLSSNLLWFSFTSICEHINHSDLVRSTLKKCAQEWMVKGYSGRSTRRYFGKVESSLVHKRLIWSRLKQKNQFETFTGNWIKTKCWNNFTETPKT